MRFLSSDRSRGILFVMLSALLYGFTPVLAALSYEGGNNGLNMAFLRALLPIPVFLILVRRCQKPSPRQLRLGLLCGLLSFGCTAMLYSSYAYLSVGVATTLHFLYPLYVAVFEAIFRKKPLKPQCLAGLALAVGGMVLFLEKGGKLSLPGMALALGSGVVYAAYILLLGEEAKDPLPVHFLMLLVSCSGVVLCGGIGMAAGRLSFALTPKAWLCAVAAVGLVVFFACTLFQRGVRLIGGTDTAIFSLLEPITSIIFSVLLMQDSFTLRKALGCAVILLGLALAALPPRPKKI